MEYINIDFNKLTKSQLIFYRTFCYTSTAYLNLQQTSLYESLLRVCFIGDLLRLRVDIIGSSVRLLRFFFLRSCSHTVLFSFQLLNLQSKLCISSNEDTDGLLERLFRAFEMIDSVLHYSSSIFSAFFDIITLFANRDVAATTCATHTCIRKQFRNKHIFRNIIKEDLLCVATFVFPL